VKVQELIEAEGDANLALRVAVRPGGCSGFSYEMFFDSETESDDLFQVGELHESF
jgi:iron-sulfur cluster assembly protein/iron-sulfur cluster insertion protein